MPSKFNIILDTDIGTDIDDAFALALALRAPSSNLNLLGISTVKGDTKERARIAKKMLAIEGKESLPIFAGIPSKSKLIYGKWASDTNLEGVSVDVEEMVDFYWKMIDSKSNKPLYIVAIGPLSNIAMVRATNPEEFDEKVNLLIMGGAIHKGILGKLNIIPEFNIFYDIKASKVLFSSNVRLNMVPLDVTANLRLSRKDLESLSSPDMNNRLLDGVLEMSKEFRKHLLGFRPLIMFDPATIATLIDDSLATFTELPIKITKLGFTRVIKKPINNIDETVQPKQVCLDFDKEKFFELFFRLLTS
ncbi:MAG: nucleoside hydrolase [Candidatus Hodarchaeota archaeon]